MWIGVDSLPVPHVTLFSGAQIALTLNPHSPPPRSYIPFLADIFSIVPLSMNEWLLVLLWSAPVCFIDEVLKALGRGFFGVQKIKVD